MLCRNGKWPTATKPERLPPPRAVVLRVRGRGPHRVHPSSDDEGFRPERSREGTTLDSLLLMGHGTRDPEGVEELGRLVDAVRAGMDGIPVEAGVLEFEGPRMGSIRSAIQRCAQRGDRHVVGIPVLLHHAGHSKADMPGEIAWGRAQYPQLQIEVASCLGIQDSLLEVAEQRIREAHPHRDIDGTAVLLVGRGASDPEANADFFKVGRLLWERNYYRWVECCFVSLAQPHVPDGIERCVRLGASRVLVVPYFLNTGVLVKRISEQASAARAVYPEVEILVGQHLGVHPRLVQLIVDQAHALDQAAGHASALAGAITPGVA